jgi:hypothetical protein
MPKRNDGNEQDLRVRPFNDAHSLEDDNPMTGARPEGGEPCDEHGEQVDLPETPPCGAPIEIETPDGTILYDWADLSYVCPNGFSTRSLDQFFMAVLKNHFSDPDKIWRENLKEFVYKDGSDTQICIMMNTSWDSTTFGGVPCIVVKRGQQKPARLTIGDRGTTTSVLQGDDRYVRMMQGSHRVMCMAAQDGVTEDLALEVWDLFTCLSPVFRQDLPYHDFQTQILSELGILEATGSSLGVVIQCSYAYEYAWTVTRHAPNLRATNVDTDIELSTEVG